MNSNEKQLQELVNELLSQTGNGGSKKLYEELVEAVNDCPLLLWDTEGIDTLSQAALRILLLDVIEEEDAEIQWAHKTYAFITQALLRGRAAEAEVSVLFKILRNRVILLHSHDDFFLDTLDYFFFHGTPVAQETDRNERRAFLLKRIAAMQVQDLQTLETYDKDLKADDYLLDAEQKLLDKYQFSEEELIEAQLLSDTLFKYIWHQIKNS